MKKRIVVTKSVDTPIRALNDDGLKMNLGSKLAVALQASTNNLKDSLNFLRDVAKQLEAMMYAQIPRNRWHDEKGQELKNNFFAWECEVMSWPLSDDIKRIASGGLQTDRLTSTKFLSLNGVNYAVQREMWKVAKLKGQRLF